MEAMRKEGQDLRNSPKVTKVRSVHTLVCLSSIHQVHKGQQLLVYLILKCILFISQHLHHLPYTSQGLKWFSVLDLMRTSDLRWPLIICVVLQMSQQFSGIIAKSLETYSFLPFSVMLLLFFIFTYMFVPETKGKSISEITQLFKSPTMDRSEFRNSYKSSKNRYSTQVLIIDPPLSEKGTEYYIESSYL
ncbi:solute carrier family 2, facilitated glucose transporter member 3-like [Biomphalaria glabrata]|uniref:Solute carrier family 2, facilitated glucose transporter member 3-like n=1 Tax=Biomphalaria glabrata TaxID=6526 RepID=A0A9W3AZE2_BIOGL|nr:solute carrier family 2, facilitated glucose transporter member 3-like [Biomphalaria glabrata]